MKDWTKKPADQVSGDADEASRLAAAPRALTCAEVQQHLLQTHHPGDPQPPPIADHLTRCTTCAAFCAQLLRLDDGIRDQAPDLPAGFELALRRRLNEGEKTDARSVESPMSLAGMTHTPADRGIPHRALSIRRGIPLALASAAILLVVWGTLYLLHHRSDGEPRTYHRLCLTIQSSRDFAVVRFNVELPEGVQLLPATGSVVAASGTPAWQSPVRRGINEIDLPLVASRRDGVVRVHVRAGNEVWTGSVALGVRETSLPRASDGELRLACLIGTDFENPQRGSR